MIVEKINEPLISHIDHLFPGVIVSRHFLEAIFVRKLERFDSLIKPETRCRAVSFVTGIYRRRPSPGRWGHFYQRK